MKLCALLIPLAHYKGMGITFSVLTALAAVYSTVRFSVLPVHLAYSVVAHYTVLYKKGNF